MRCLAAVAACTLVLFSASSRAEEPTTQRTDPKLPDAPGPFHAYNVTGKYKGRYHSQISEFGLEPMVMLFTRETEFSDPLKDLLKQIDNAAEKNPAARSAPVPGGAERRPAGSDRRRSRPRRGQQGR